MRAGPFRRRNGLLRLEPLSEPQLTKQENAAVWCLKTAV